MLKRKARLLRRKKRRLRPTHEAGHAILFHLLPDEGPVHTISIIPTGVSAAVIPCHFRKVITCLIQKARCCRILWWDLGGRIAEDIIFGDITTGASQDIKQATALARAMVTQYGMSDQVGMINYDNDGDEVFIGRDLAHTKNYGGQVANTIDNEVKRIIDECYEKAKEIILKHEDVLHACCKLLMEKEKIGQKEFESLFPAEAEV